MCLVKYYICSLTQYHEECVPSGLSTLLWLVLYRPHVGILRNVRLSGDETSRSKYENLWLGVGLIVQASCRKVPVAGPMLTFIRPPNVGKVNRAKFLTICVLPRFGTFCACGQHRRELECCCCRCYSSTTSSSWLKYFRHSLASFSGKLSLPYFGHWPSKLLMKVCSMMGFWKKWTTELVSAQLRPYYVLKYYLPWTLVYETLLLLTHQMCLGEYWTRYSYTGWTSKDGPKIVVGSNSPKHAFCTTFMGSLPPLQHPAVHRESFHPLFLLWLYGRLTACYRLYVAIWYKIQDNRVCTIARKKLRASTPNEIVPNGHDQHKVEENIYMKVFHVDCTTGIAIGSFSSQFFRVVPGSNSEIKVPRLPYPCTMLPNVIYCGVKATSRLSTSGLQSRRFSSRWDGSRHE